MLWGPGTGLSLSVLKLVGNGNLLILLAAPEQTNSTPSAVEAAGMVEREILLSPW